MSKVKLKWKIFAYLLGFCGLLIILLWLFQTVFLYDMYKFIRAGEINQAIISVKENIDNPELESIKEKLLKEKDIMITNTNAFIPPKPHGKDNKGRKKQETITKTKVFIFDDSSSISLTFHAIITPVDATISTLKNQLYIITGIMVFMSVILATIISKRVSKPLEDINISAKILSKGDYSVFFDGKGFLEIKELSDTLNKTALELSKVDNLRKELMANVSHDLRTPLSLIYSYAEMMNDFPEEITTKQTQLIMDETKRLSYLVNDILDLSNFENEKMELNISEFNITDMIRSITKRIGELVKQQGYNIKIDFDTDYYVNADKVKMARVYYNLLINAINYCDDSKIVEIKQSIKNNKIKIEIINQGEGILEEELQYIWDKYYTSNKTHKRAVVGSGLGLSIVKKILELHKAGFGVISDINKGSNFWFEMDCV